MLIYGKINELAQSIIACIVYTYDKATMRVRRNKEKILYDMK